MRDETVVTGSVSSEIEVGELVRRIDAGERPFVLDVRNEEEVKAWKLEGRGAYETLHVPYFEFLEEEDASVARVPKDRGEVFVLCAKGGSSEYVAGVLRERGYAARNVTGGMVAYGGYLQPVPVPLTADEAARFQIWQLNRRGKGCLSYLVRANDEAVVIDPSRHVGFYQELARGLGARIVRVLDTHVHADHLSGGPALAEASHAPYFVAAGEGFRLEQKVSPLGDGEALQLGGEGGVTIAARVVATPGHTPGSTSYLVDGKYLFSGDTLFVAGVGRPDLGGQAEAWGRALFHTLHERMKALDDGTVVLPGHYADTSEIGADGAVVGALGEVRRNAPEFQLATADEFVAAMKEGVKPAPEVYGQIVKANLGLLAVNDDQATEWELGKNACAATARAKALRLQQGGER